MSIKPTSRFLPYIAMLVIGVVWATTIPLIKIAVGTGLQPFGITFWELVFAVTILGAIVFSFGYKVSLKREHLVFCLILSLTGTLFPNIFSYSAAAKLPAGIMALIIATVPMCSLMVALLVKNEQPSLRRLGGVLIGVAAMALLAIPGTTLPDAGTAIFVLVAFVAPLSYGIEGNFISAKAPKAINPISLLFVASVIALPIAGILALLTNQFFVPSIFIGEPFSNAEWAIVAFAIAHAFAYAGYIWLVSLAGPVFTAQIAYVVTITAVGLSWFFLNEEYANTVWMALVMILFGLALVRPKSKTATPK